MKTIVALLFALLAGTVMAQSSPPYTVTLGLQSVNPSPAPVNQPIHIVPIVQPQGNTNSTLPTGIVEVGIYNGPASTLALVTSCNVPLNNLAAGCDVTLNQVDKYEIMLHYPGDANFQSTYSAKTKLHVYDGSRTNKVPALGYPALLLLGLLMLLAAMKFVRRRTD
ncbi:MAG: hypothetical protein WCD36_10485 [Rhodanobacteraceae bacterium]